MATREQRQEYLGLIKDQISELSSIDPQKLGRREELSQEINFEGAVEPIQELFDMVSPLLDRSLDRLPYEELGKIHSSFKTLLSFIEQIKSFKLTGQEKPDEACQSIINNINGSQDAIMQNLVMPLAFTATQATDYAKVEREARGTLSQIKEEHSRIVNLTHRVETDAKAGLEAVQKQVAESGVSANAQVFRAESKTHADLAKAWLNKTYWFSGITISVAIAFFSLVFFYQPKSTPEAIQYVFAKLILLSTLMFALIWCAKNYKSHKHNETLNNHRANALNTFQTFYTGTSDTQVKNTILLQAAHAAFSNRSTGYEATHEKDGQPTTQVIDIFGKSVTPITKASQTGASTTYASTT
ncbi:hypothetical protein CA11_33130 [Gimesia maris]|uniref:hypothetical protein n=1 Tax=Gimesia maris TaxID=122 RepID=UPI0011898D56|nr:hypothetical protein [Gimesia maris]QDU15488.1 hypothetical protein CA11_33130 [Gimesia maris]